MREIKISCPGSCGELFQGLFGEQEVLLSYGIDRRSCAALQAADAPESVQLPGEKVRQAVALLAEGDSLALCRESNLPVGKGYSSSTADMISCLQAAAVQRGQLLTAAELTRLCACIEPTDSVAFADWTAINPLSGQIIWQTDWRPDLYVYILEPAQEQATLDLVRMKDCCSYPAAESQQLLPLFQKACRQRDVEQVGQLATYSALLNDQRLPKPYLKELMRLTEEFSFPGLNIAHSGTLVGLLLRPEELELLPQLEARLARSAVSDYYQKRSLSQLMYEGVQPVREVTESFE
ncbi:GHMP family kinase ATP-binding protein [Streptococcus panodentis]|uniref:Kinase n=1 Tax=Streptococcus panodentis TaxID=1581472 RepID=A0ABS5AXP1_9STRE|nr:kinase [Streptococcus panodentis]MBP2621339.1 kinase [Streptococcus panodentis]